MTLVPQNWSIAPIGEVAGDCEKKVPDTHEMFRYIDIASIDRESKTIASPQTLVGKDAPTRARKQVRAQDVLVSMTRPNLNAVAIVPESLDGEIASTGFDVLRPLGINPRWLLYLVRTEDFIDRMSELVQGALYPAVRPGDVRGYQAPIAPLNEQRRIADKLDAILARVDACRERLDRVPEILRRLRQSVLGAATCGDLTEDWRDAKGLSTAWLQTTLGAVGQVTGGITKNSSRRDANITRKYLRVANVYANRLELDSISEIATTPAEFARTRLNSGDILIVEGNGSLDHIGRAALWHGDIDDCAHQNHLIRWRTAGEVLPEFALYWLLSPSGRSTLVEYAKSTAGLHTLSLSKVSAVPIKVPPIEEQTEVVRRVAELFAQCDRLEARYRSARALVDRITPALLAKAFRGELVPQDPDDEPAALLLERIRIARAADLAKPRKSVKGRRSIKLRPAEAIMLTREDIASDHLSAILTERGPLTAEVLWSAAQLGIDDFYDQLKDEEARGLLRERPGNSHAAPRLLEVVT